MNNKGIPQNLNQLYQTVGEIKGKVDAIDKKLDTIANNHEHRINAIEKSVDTFQGKAMGAGAVAGFIITIIGLMIAFFKKWF